MHNLCATVERPQHLAQHYKLLEMLAERQHTVAVAQLHRLLLNVCILLVVEHQAVTCFCQSCPLDCWVLHRYDMLVAAIEVLENSFAVPLDFLLQMAQKSMLEGTQLGVQSGYLFRWSISNHVTNKLFGVQTAVQQVTEHWVHHDELIPVVH